MYWTDIPSDGTYAILPTKTRGVGINTYTSSETTRDPTGMVVVEGGGTVTLGFFNGTGASAVFQAFADGLLSTADVYVQHGIGVRLAAQVTGAATLRIGYAGASR